MFKLVDRQKERFLVIIGGWAFDYRIFTGLDLPFNYIFSDGDQNGLKKNLKEKGIDKISLLGWSKGVFAACDFASDNADITEEVILVSARKKYEKIHLAEIKMSLKKNKTAFLKWFYKQCFCQAEIQNYNRFKNTLLKEYLRRMSLNELIEGLDRLSQAAIKTDSLKKIKNIKFVHGQNDAIAPLSEAFELSNTIKQSKLIVFDGAGHLPFLHKDFKRRLYEN